MAANISFANFSKATELKKRIWFTLGALVLFRFLSFVPMPGIDPRAMAALFDTQRGGVLDFFNTFSGGSLERMSIIALGVMPYITASIVVQLAGSLYGPWQQLKKEGETGRKKLNQYTRYLTVLLTTVQGYWIAVGLESLGAAQGISAVVEPGMMFRVAATISLVGGTLVPDVDRRADHQPRHRQRRLPDHHGRHRRDPAARRSRNCSKAAVPARSTRCWSSTIVALAVGLVLFICFVERAQRRVPIQYPKRQTRARHDAGGTQPPADQDQHLRRHPADLRFVAAADAADRPADGRCAEQSGVRRLADHHQHVPAARLAACTCSSTAQASPSSASSTRRCSSTARKRPRI